MVIVQYRSRRWQMFFKIAVLKNFVNFTGKHVSVLESLFNKVASLKVCNFMEKRLQHRAFPVKFTKFFKNAFFTEHLWWLFLVVNNVNQLKHTLKVYAAEKEMIYRKGSSKVSVSR